MISSSFVLQYILAFCVPHCKVLSKIVVQYKSVQCASVEASKKSNTTLNTLLHVSYLLLICAVQVSPLLNRLRQVQGVHGYFNLSYDIMFREAIKVID